MGEGSGITTLEQTKINTPLYVNVQSKIGSGVNQPYNYQAQQAKIKSQINKDSGVQKSRRIRMGPAGQSGPYNALINS